MRTSLSLAVVGVNYPNKRGPTRRFELAVCRPGEPVELRLEPDNPADEHAVAVFSGRGVQMGYLPSVRAVQIGQIIRRGTEVRAVFQEEAPWGGVIRIAFDGEEPRLPPARAQPFEPPDFWPDEVWPDE